jgi:hypothetical protein
MAVAGHSRTFSVKATLVAAAWEAAAQQAVPRGTNTENDVGYASGKHRQLLIGLPLGGDGIPLGSGYDTCPLNMHTHIAPAANDKAATCQRFDNQTVIDGIVEAECCWSYYKDTTAWPGDGTPLGDTTATHAAAWTLANYGQGPLNPQGWVEAPPDIAELIADAVAAGDSQLLLLLTKDVSDAGRNEILSNDSADASKHPYCAGTIAYPEPYDTMLDCEPQQGVPAVTVHAVKFNLGTRTWGGTDRVRVNWSVNSDMSSPTNGDWTDLSSASAYDDVTLAITGLTGATRYYFEIEFDDGTNQYITDTDTFSTIVGSDEDVTITFMFDHHGMQHLQAGTTSALEMLALTYENIRALQPHLHVEPGDCQDYGDAISSTHYPINEDGTEDSPTSRYVTDQTDADRVARVGARLNIGRTPTLMIEGNHMPDAWHFDTANNGAASDAYNWMLSALQEYGVHPSGLPSSAGDTGRLVSDDSDGRYGYIDIGCVRLCFMQPRYKSEYGKTDELTIPDDLPDPLPTGMADLNDYTLGDDQIDFFFDESTGVISNFAASGMKWLVVVAHHHTGGTTYGRFGNADYRLGEWWADAAWQTADPYGRETGYPLLYANGIHGLLNLYAPGRVLVAFGHDHHFSKQKTGQVQYTVGPTPSLYTDGFITNYTGIPTRHNGGFVKMLANRSCLEWSYLRSYDAEIGLTPSDGITTNGAIVDTVTLGEGAVSRPTQSRPHQKRALSRPNTARVGSTRL